MNTFSATDDYSILDVIADDKTVSSDYEWGLYLDALSVCVVREGDIHPNTLRPLLTQISPARRGAFTRRAKLAGILLPTGEYEVSDDHGSRNGGKAQEVYRLNIDTWLAVRSA
jgi:hypothetical protein